LHIACRRDFPQTEQANAGKWGRKANVSLRSAISKERVSEHGICGKHELFQDDFIRETRCVALSRDKGRAS
jgi:hypothetical protein